MGSPTAGRIKIYGSFDDPEAFRTKLEVALGLRLFAREQLAKAEEGGS